MRVLFAVMMALGVFVVSAAHLSAQQPPDVKPGPEHAWLKESEGTWDAAVKSMGSESKGTETCRMGLNGLWLLDHFQCNLGGAAFEGRGATSYDPVKKKYVNVWIDSMSTRPMVSEGAYDKATRTLTMTGTMPMPDGTTMKATLLTVFKDADTKTFTLSAAGADGKSMEMIHITYKRRAR